MKIVRLTAIIAVLQIILVYKLIISWPDSMTRIIFCDVGQGDAILITSGFRQVLIDAGPDRSVLECLQAEIPFWDRDLDLVVATHPDADHIGGMPDVFEQYRVGIFLENGQQKDSAEAATLYQAVQKAKKRGTVSFSAAAGQSLLIGQKMAFSVVFPQVEIGQQQSIFSQIAETTLQDNSRQIPQENNIKINTNDGSIALILKIGSVIVFLPGDLEKKSEQALIASGLLNDVDILKVGHHGSNSSTTREILGEIRPENAVISCGKNNRYNHPSPEVLSNLVAFGANIYRTDQQGTVIFATDGERYWLQD